MAMGGTLVDELTDALQSKKMLDKYPNEDLGTIRLIKQLDCFYCHRPWYISEAKLFFHQNKQLENPHWRFPTSCPECRKHSKVEAMHARQSVCRTGKKEFVTAKDAELFSRETLEKNGLAPQRSYQCTDCTLFHLTSKELVTTVSSGPLTSSLSNVVQMAKPSVERKKKGESRTEIAELIGLGLSTNEIATRLNMTTTNMLYHKRKLEGATTPTRPAVKPVAMNVEELDPNELDVIADRLYAQLEEIERKKTRLAEARKLRVELANGAISIVKEGEHILLPFAERDKLVSLLTQLAVPTVATTGTN